MVSDGFERIPLIVSFQETAGFTETYGFAGSQGRVFLEGQLLRKGPERSRGVLLFMHPSSTLNLMPMPAAFARAGVDAICCGSRFAKNDTALIMEKVVMDLGAYMRHARDVLGYERVTIAGWSGGGALALFYQSQAENPTIRDTPAGDPADLVGAGLIPADAVFFVAAHIGRARILSEWIDPSVLDELDPDRRDPALDLYAPDGPKPPYDPAFLDRFRAAQKARMERITGWAQETLAALTARGTGEVERGFVVHRTLADPRFLDGSIEPNGRPVGRCYMGVPETVNTGPVGLARFTTLRAWLSQWSPGDTRADAETCAARLSAPLLAIENGADDAVPPSHPRAVFQAAASPDKEHHVIDGASHYYRGQPEKLEQALALCLKWLKRRDLI